MANIKQLFWELKLEVLKIALFKSFLNAIIFFLALNIIFSLFEAKFYYALILAFLFFAVNTYLSYSAVTLKRIEDKNPEVREMLRTAKDNMGQDNIMIRALHAELLSKAKRIYTGNIMEYKSFILKVFIIGVLTIGTIFLATLNIHIGEIGNPLDRFSFNRGSYGLDVPVDLSDSSLISSDDIYGDARIAKLGNEVINLNLNPSMSEMDLNKLKDEEDISLSKNTYPVEVKAQGAALVGEKKPEESELVNAYYMRKIKK
ncbi:MAG: hypothetical protein V1743_01835 [Nanoarchaeota archaeon]